MESMIQFLTFHRKPKKVFGFSLAALFVAVCVVVANGFLASIEQGYADAIPRLSAGGWSKNSVSYGVVLAVSIYLVCCMVERVVSSSSRREYFLRAPYAIAVTSLVLILAWLPLLMVLYPGVMYHDTVFQLAQFFGDAPLDVYTGSENAHAPKITDHHPVMTTLTFSFFAWLGQMSGKAYNGLFILGLIQSLALAMSLACAIVYAHRKLLLGRASSLILIVFCAAFPLFPVYGISLSKDVMFAPLFIIFSLVFAEIVRTRGECLSKRGLVFVLACVCLGLSMTKKVGFYVVAFCMIVIFLWCRDRRVIAVTNGALSFAFVFVVLPYGVFPLIDAGSGSSKEMLSVPYEQTALYVKEHQDDVSSYEQAILDKVLTYDTLADRFRPETADYVKNFAPENESLFDYLSVYLKQGIRHPLTYMRAFLSLEAGFVGTEDAYTPLLKSASNDTLNELDTDRKLDVYPDAETERLEAARAIGGIINAASQFPLIGLLFTKGLYSFIVPIVVCVLIASRAVKRIVLISPYLVFTALLYVSPISTGVNAGRYVFPLLCLTPLVVGAVAYTTKSCQKASTDRYSVPN